MEQLKVLWEKYTDYKYLGMCLMSIVLLVVVFGLVVWPFYEKHLLLEQEGKAIQQRLQLLEQFAGKYPNYDVEHEKLEQKVLGLQEQLPNSLAGADVMRKVQKIAQSSGIMLNANLISSNRIQEKLVSTGVDVKGRGSYAAMLRFLENLEQSNLVGLDQLNLEAGADGVLTLNAKYYVYSIKES